MFLLQVEYLLNTGNLVSSNSLDLSQATGFTVVAEKLNFFRCPLAQPYIFHDGAVGPLIMGCVFA